MDRIHYTSTLQNSASIQAEGRQCGDINYILRTRVSRETKNTGKSRGQDQPWLIRQHNHFYNIEYSFHIKKVYFVKE